MKSSTKWIVGLLLVVGCAFAGNGMGAPETWNGETLLRAMHDRYRDNWYETVKFTQKSTTHNQDGTSKSEIWREAAMLPGKLRIDIGPPSDGNGVIVADGTLTSFQSGKVSETRPLVHMLLVLGFDVYRQQEQVTIDQVKGQGFNLDKIHEDMWEGEPVHVVGADKGDLTSKQFWVEKKRLLFVRMLEPDERDKTKISDTRFTDYRQLSVGWIAARVEFYVDGRNIFSEEYSDIQTNPKLDASIFDPERFSFQHRNE